MSEEKDGRIVIAAERIGLPANAPTDAIVDRIYTMQEHISTLEKALAETVTLAEQRKQSEEQLKRLQAKTFVEEAARNQWIDKVEVEDYIEDFIADPIRTQKRIEKLKYKGILAKTMSLRAGEETKVDVDAEIDAKAAEIMAGEQAFRGKPAAARLEVLKRNERLSELHREKYTTGVKKEGQS